MAKIIFGVFCLAGLHAALRHYGGSADAALWLTAAAGTLGLVCYGLARARA